MMRHFIITAIAIDKKRDWGTFCSPNPVFDFIYILFIIFVVQRPKCGKRTLDLFKAYTIGYSYISATTEAVAGYKEKFVFFCFLAKRGGVGFKRFYEKIKRTVRLYRSISHFGKAVIKERAVFIISRDI